MLRSKAFLPLFFSILLLFFTNSVINAQETDILMTNSRSIEEGRYQGVRGSPYLFKNWQKGKIISVDADAIEGVLLNYNGMTNGFEVKKGNSFIELDPKWYIRVVIEGEESDEPIIFQRNFLPPLKDKFTRLVYKGKKLKIIEEILTKIDTKVIHNVGKDEELKKFYTKTKYYLIKDRKPIFFKLKKKNVLAILEHSSEIEAYLKKEKMKLNSEEELIKLITFYEASGF